MNKALLLALALIVVGCGHEGRHLDHELARKYVFMDSIGRGLFQYLDIETFEPYTGSVYQDVFEGRFEGPSYTGYLNNGFMDGPQQYWWPNGQLSRLFTYVEGVEHGPYERYEDDGTIGQRGAYDMGSRCGDWVQDGEYLTYDPCPPDLENFGQKTGTN